MVVNYDEILNFVVTSFDEIFNYVVGHFDEIFGSGASIMMKY